MVPVNGTPIIDRLMRQLAGLNLTRIVIVVGYKGENLKTHLDGCCQGMNVVYVENPIYDKTNNIYSLFLARQYMREDDTLLVESDIIIDDGMFEMLIGCEHPNVALVAKYESWMDGTMVRIDEDDNIVNFVTKSAFNYDEVAYYYKTVNLYKFSKDFSATKYVPFLEAYTTAVGNNEYYENVLRVISFLNSSDLKALSIQNKKWYEIDDKQDLDIAEAIFAEEGDILRKFYGRYGGYWRFPKMLDYCYLVNPYFPSNRFVDEMQSNFRTLLTEYPSGMKVNSLLASKCWGVREEYIIPGNGAAELIKLLMEDMRGKVGVVRPTFEEYPNRLPQDCWVTYMPNNSDYRYGVDDLMDYYQVHHIDNLLLLNPDNPSGNFIAKQDVLRLADWCRQNSIRLLVDESFVDFSEEWETCSLLSDTILEQYPNLIVMKSISKSYGVPGLRLGIMASSNVEMIARMKKQVSIWNLNSFAEYFMQILSKYESDYKRACYKFQDERRWFEQQLLDIKFLRVIPSQANYFLVEILPPYKATSIVMRLLKHNNILTRDCSSKMGLDGKQYMRIAVRDRQDNERFIEALKALE